MDFFICMKKLNQNKPKISMWKAIESFRLTSSKEE